MSVATQTLIPRPYRFPALLAKAQQPPSAAKFSFSDLDDEESELEELLGNIRNHGFASILPIGRTTTREEQKVAAASESDTDDDDDDDDSGEEMTSESASESMHELEELGSDEEEDAMDMDADLEDLDFADAREDLSDEESVSF
ncbi:hypothetical protein CPB85DRAFT_563344 [Mucidula mucida]|nr:hypothetical protein CPB85DRAFT_563344 [Mucidula mucida]